MRTVTTHLSDDYGRIDFPYTITGEDNCNTVIDFFRELAKIYPDKVYHNSDEIHDKTSNFEMSFDFGSRCTLDIVEEYVDDEESEKGEPKDVYEEAEMCGARPY